MANQVRVGVGVTGARQASSELDRFRDKFTKLQQQGAKGVAIGAGLGVFNAGVNIATTAVSGLTDYIGEAIHAASDLNETESKSRVVFGQAADAVDRFGSTAAKSMGMSKQAAIEAAASFGNVFTGVGIAQAKAADMSESLVKLAGDLASFNNIDPTEALEKLRSGLAGEAEPLRSVGVFLTEAQVKAKAMEMGLADAHGELTEGAKILARYQLILAQTKTAQGDFARTSDGVANSERILNAEMEDREALIGQKLLPLEREWQKLRLQFATTSGAIISGLDAENNSAEQNRQNLVDLLNTFGGLGDALVPLPYQLAKFTTAQGEAGAAALRLSEHTDSFTKAADEGAATLPQFTGNLDDLRRTIKDTDRAIDDLTTAVDDGLFGKAITAGHEAQLKDNIKDLEKQRSETHKGSLKWLELTGEIAQNREELFNLHLEEAAKKGPQAAIKFLQEQKKLFGDNNGKLQALIDKYRTLITLEGKLGTVHIAGGVVIESGGVLDRRASGGPVSRGKAYTVGENGPETFVAPDNGTIIPNGGGGPSGGFGGTVVNINVSTPALTPGGAEALARAIAPHLTRWQQQRGLVGGVRAF